MSAQPVSIAGGVARQCGKKLITSPGRSLPPLLLPLFMFAAFAGALKDLGGKISYYNYTAFVFVFVLYMASMFAAVFTAFEIAGDFESGWGNRMMLAAPKRVAIIAGYLVVAFVRGLIGIAVIFAVALATGMPVKGNALDIAGLVALALLLNQIVMLYGAGVALRFQSAASGVLVLIPTFMLFFVAPNFVPRSSLTGWLRDVADVNPLTAVLESGRGLLARSPFHVALAFGVCAGAMMFFFVFSLRGLRKAERGPAERISEKGGRRGPRSRRPGTSEPTGGSPEAGGGDNRRERGRARRARRAAT